MAMVSPDFTKTVEVLVGEVACFRGGLYMTYPSSQNPGIMRLLISNGKFEGFTDLPIRQLRQGSLNYPTHIHGKFKGFPLNSAWFGLAILIMAPVLIVQWKIDRSLVRETVFDLGEAHFFNCHNERAVSNHCPFIIPLIRAYFLGGVGILGGKYT